MGGWYPQGDQVGRRHEGPEDAHRRLRRQGARAHRRRAAEHPRRRDLSRRSRRARSTPPSGSARTTTRSSASTRSRRTTTTPAGGKAARSSTSSSTPRPGTRCRPSTRRSSRRAALARARRHAGASTTRSNPAALKRLVGGGTKLRPLPAGRDGRGVQGVDGAVRRAERQERRAGRRSTTTTSRSGATQNLWFRFTEARLRQTSCRRRSCEPLASQPIRKAPHCGAFFCPALSTSCARLLRLPLDRLRSGRPRRCSLAAVRRRPERRRGRCRIGAAATGVWRHLDLRPCRGRPSCPCRAPLVTRPGNAMTRPTMMTWMHHERHRAPVDLPGGDLRDALAA